MPNDTILTMKNISKRFPGVVALDNVDIELKKNEILAIVGENGAGKSTLMKILSGTYPYGSYEGKIEINGVQQKLMSSRGAEEAGVAMIYQEISVELDLSVAENILLGMLPKNKLGLIDWKKTYSEANRILQQLNLDLDLSIPVGSLSASIQQLVCIARALIRKPKILILDEPTAALTESETANLMKILRDLKTNGISCIYISHKLDEVFNIADRVIAMRDGKVVSSYLKDEIVPRKIIEDMIGRRLDMMYPSVCKSIGDEVMRVENITVQHEYSANKNIIENVSFSVKKGEILGLTGLVGSGRSELLKAIYGALPRKSGKILIDDKECSISEPSDAIRSGIGLLTEDRKKDGYIGTMNIKENMTLPILRKISRNRFINSRKENDITSHYFKYMNIKAPGLNTNILNLSGGNQQKVILAKSLLTEMKVLFLDEPTRGIDIGAKAEIYKIIADLASKGLSIVMVSSELPELLALCDRFVVLGKGKVLAEVSKEEASEAGIMHIASCC